MASGLKENLSQGQIQLGLVGYPYVVISHFCQMATVGIASRNTSTAFCANLPSIMTQRYKPELLLQFKWIFWDSAPEVCGQWKKTRLKINNNRFLWEIFPIYQNVKLQMEDLVFINIWSRKKSSLFGNVLDYSLVTMIANHSLL